MALLITPLILDIDCVSKISWFGKTKSEKGGWVSQSTAGVITEIQHIAM